MGAKKTSNPIEIYWKTALRPDLINILQVILCSCDWQVVNEYKSAL